MMNSMRTCKNSITVFPLRYFEQKNALNYATNLQQKFDKSQIKLHHRFSRVNLLYNSRVFVYISYQRHMSHLKTMHFYFTDVTSW